MSQVQVHELNIIIISRIEAFQIYKFHNFRPNISGKRAQKPHKNTVNIIHFHFSYHLKYSLAPYLKTIKHHILQIYMLIKLSLTIFFYQFSRLYAQFPSVIPDIFVFAKLLIFGAIFHYCHNCHIVFWDTIFLFHCITIHKCKCNILYKGFFLSNDSNMQMYHPVCTHLYVSHYQN